jgi:hypothetical protein
MILRSTVVCALLTVVAAVGAPAAPLRPRLPVESFTEALHVWPLAAGGVAGSAQDVSDSRGACLLQATWRHTLELPDDSGDGGVEARLPSENAGGFPPSVAALWAAQGGGVTGHHGDLQALHVSLSSPGGGWDAAAWGAPPADAAAAAARLPPGLTVHAAYRSRISSDGTHRTTAGGSSGAHLFGRRRYRGLALPPGARWAALLEALSVSGGGGAGTGPWAHGDCGRVVDGSSDDADVCALQTLLAAGRESEPALPLGVPLGAGLGGSSGGSAAGADTSADFDDGCASASALWRSATACGVTGGGQRAWHTHAAVNDTTGTAAFSLALPTSSGGGHGGGLPWERVAALLLARLHPCGGAAGLGAVLTPSRVAALAAGGGATSGDAGDAASVRSGDPRRRPRPARRGTRAPYVGLSLSLARECGGGANGSTGACALVLTRRFAVVLQPAALQPPKTADGSGIGGASSAAPLPSLASLLGYAGRAPPPACAASGDATIVVHEGAAAAATTHPLRALADVSLPPTSAGTVPSSLQLPPTVRLAWARRQLTQARQGHGVLVSVASVAVGGSGSNSGRGSTQLQRRLRLLVLTPTPWFLGIVDDDISSGSSGTGAAVALSGGDGAAYAAAVKRLPTGAHDAAPPAVTAEAWLDQQQHAPPQPTSADSTQQPLVVTLASSVVLSPAPRGRPGLHVAVVDVTLPAPAAAAPPTQATTVAVSLPWVTPGGLLHADECPPDAHRGLDVPPGTLTAVVVDAAGSDAAGGGSGNWAAAPDAAAALAAVTRCFRGGGGGGETAGCPAHPWDPTAILPVPYDSNHTHISSSGGGGDDGDAARSVPTPAAAASAYLQHVTVEAPCPDFSMPYNAVVLVATAAAFVLGSLVNVSARKRRPAAAAATSAAGAAAVPPPPTATADDGSGKSKAE